MPGRNKLKNWINKTIPVYFRELFDVVMSYTDKGGRPLVINSAETGVEEGRFSADAFDVTKLPGYGIKAVATGDGSVTVVSTLVPFLSDGDECDISLSTGIQTWSAAVVGIGSATAAGDALLSDAVIAFGVGVGTNWRSTLDDGGSTDYYADVPIGFYWLCLPGSGGTSVKFWYDRQKVFDVIANKPGWVYIDQAGCLWFGDPESGGTFICGPTVEDGFGKNIFNTYSDDNQSIISMCPMANGGDTCRIDAHSGSSTWQNFGNGVGLSKLFSGGGDSGIINNGSIFYFNVPSGTWSSFADVPSGMYETQIPYKDVSANSVEGTKLRFWYDRDKYIQKFRGNAVYAYIDHIGNIWKGNPELGGVFVCGPYPSSNVIEERSIKVKATENDIAPGYLKDKIGETDNLKIIEVNDAGNERLDIKVPRYPEFDVAYTYAQNDYVSSVGTIYKCIAVTSIGNTPPHADWEELSGASVALGADGTILAGETEVTVIFTGEAGNYNRAAVTLNGLNGGQRAVYVKSGPYDDSTDLKVDVAIDSVYTEDIDFHVVLANE